MQLSNIIARLPTVLFVLSILILIPSLIFVLYLGFKNAQRDPYDYDSFDEHAMRRYHNMVLIALCVSFISACCSLGLMIRFNQGDTQL